MTADRSVKSRRRGEVLRVAILEAAWAELQEYAWSGFQMDRVAVRAGTGKAVIYRRWPSRAALVRDASLHMRAESGHAWRSTGDLRQDLVSHLEGSAHYLDGPFGESVRGFMSEVERPSANAGLTSPAPGIVVAIVEKARAEGSLGRRDPGHLVLNLGNALVTHEYLSTGRAPTLQMITEIVDAVWLPALRAASNDA